LRLRLVFRRDARLSRRLLALAFAKFGDAVFAGGIFRRGTFCFFQRVVVSRGAFGALPGLAAEQSSAFGTAKPFRRFFHNRQA
jgi:hypothetical protein